MQHRAHLAKRNVMPTLTFRRLFLHVCARQIPMDQRRLSAGEISHNALQGQDQKTAIISDRYNMTGTNNHQMWVKMAMRMSASSNDYPQLEACNPWVKWQNVFVVKCFLIRSESFFVSGNSTAVLRFLYFAEGPQLGCLCAGLFCILMPVSNVSVLQAIAHQFIPSIQLSWTLLNELHKP